MIESSEYAVERNMSFHQALGELHTDVVKLTPKAKSGLENFVRMIHELQNKLPSFSASWFYWNNG